MKQTIKINMKEKVIGFAVGALAIVSVVAIVVGVLVYNKNSHREKILSASDVGIDTLLNETIVSAEFHSLIPNIEHECENPADIKALLNTVKDAEFTVSNKPKEPVQMLEMVILETDNGSFSVGMMGNVFTIRMNEERNYYRCSKTGDFIDKLLEIQGR